MSGGGPMPPFAGGASVAAPPPMYIAFCSSVHWLSGVLSSQSGGSIELEGGGGGGGAVATPPARSRKARLAASASLSPEADSCAGAPVIAAAFALSSSVHSDMGLERKS